MSIQGHKGNFKFPSPAVRQALGAAQLPCYRSLLLAAPSTVLEVCSSLFHLSRRLDAR